MSRKTRKLIWSAPLVAVLAVVGALAMFAAQGTGSVFANPLPAAPEITSVEPADGDAGRTTLVVTWTPVAGASGYRIDGSDNGFVWETLVAEDDKHTANSYMETGLTSEDTRWYRVFAANDHGVGPVSSPDSGETDEKAMPGAVRNFTAMADGGNQINLAWDPPADNGGEKITGYEIQFYNTNTAVTNPDWVALTTNTNTDTTSFTTVTVADYMKNGGYEDKDSDDLSLDPGESRTYRVRAVNVDPTGTITEDDRSEDWAEATGMTQAAVNPGAPTGLTAVNTAAGTVQLYWFAPENDGGWDISHYVIQVRRNVSGADWEDLPDVPDAGDYAADAFDTGDIGTDESYNFRITAPGAQVHQAEFSNVPETYDADGDPTTTADNATPVGWLFRVLTETTDDGADDDATGAADNMIRRSTGNSEVASIRAVARPDAADDTLAAPAVSATPNSGATPPILAQKQQINLSIDVPDTATNVTTQNAYRIDVSDDAGITWKQLVRDTRFTGFGDHREYEHVGLPYDETMHYRVFAVGTNWRRNVGPASALVTGSTAASEAPGKVTGVMASSPDLMTIEASWSAPEENGGQPIVKYQYQYVVDDDDGRPDAGDWAQTGDEAPMPALTDNVYTDDAELMETIELMAANALTKDELYHIRVRAVNMEAGLRTDANDQTEGPWSDAASFSTGDPTPPNMVEGLTSQVATDTNGNDAGVLLLWNKPGDGPDVASYEIQRKIGDGEWEHPTDDAEESTAQRTSFTDPRHHMMDETLAYQVRAVNAAGESGWTMVDYPREPGTHTHVAASGTIPDQTVTVDATETVDASMYFSNNTGAMYEAMSDMPMYATAMADANTGVVTITGVAAGTATITVTATSGAVEATQMFEVMVTEAALGKPTGVMATVEVDATNPDVDVYNVKVDWMDGANADVHWIHLLDLSDWSKLRSERIPGSPSPMTHTFINVDPGTYLAIVESTLGADYDYAYKAVAVE